MVRLALHQPSFFPWGGFFQKINQCDIFIILSNCPYTRRSYTNRFDIDGKWFTMSVDKVPRDTDIKDIRYTNPMRDFDTIIRKNPQESKILEIFKEDISNSLVETNVKIIKRICDIMSITTPIVGDFPTSEISTNRLVEICQYYGASTYLSGTGGKNYMDMRSFEDVGIDVEFVDIREENKQPIIKILKNKL